jgi:hypothetical protein
MWSRFDYDKATTTCYKNDNDLLMNWASIKVLPSEPVFFVLSEPAKSTKLILDITTFSLLSTLLLIYKWIVNMQCDLELALLSLCSAIVLLFSPSNSISKAAY